MKRILTPIAIVCLLVFAGGEAGARMGMNKNHNRMNKRASRLQYLKVAELIDYLNLDDETAGKLMVLMSKNRKERTAIAKELDSKAEELAALAEAEKPDKAKIEAKINDLEKTREKLNTLRDKHHNELKKLLGTVGYAKYLAFEYRWKGRMMKGMRNKRRMKKNR